jgi:hypothetical protein
MLLRYSLFALATVAGAALSGLCSMFNPVTLLLMHMTGWAVSLLGRQPSLGGFSAMGPALAISLIWPLTLAPLHWLSYRLLGWGGWGFLLLFLLVGALTAFVVLFVNAG